MTTCSTTSFSRPRAHGNFWLNRLLAFVRPVLLARALVAHAVCALRLAAFSAPLTTSGSYGFRLLAHAPSPPKPGRSSRQGVTLMTYMPLDSLICVRAPACGLVLNVRVGTVKHHAVALGADL